MWRARASACLRRSPRKTRSAPHQPRRAKTPPTAAAATSARAPSSGSVARATGIASTPPSTRPRPAVSRWRSSLSGDGDPDVAQARATRSSRVSCTVRSGREPGHGRSTINSSPWLAAAAAPRAFRSASIQPSSFAWAPTRLGILSSIAGSSHRHSTSVFSWVRPLKADAGTWVCTPSWLRLTPSRSSHSRNRPVRSNRRRTCRTLRRCTQRRRSPGVPPITSAPRMTPQNSPISAPNPGAPVRAAPTNCPVNRPTTTKTRKPTTTKKAPGCASDASSFAAARAISSSAVRTNSITRSG